MAAKEVDALEEKLRLGGWATQGVSERTLTSVEEKLAPRLQGVDDGLAALESKLDLLFGLLTKPNPREPSPGRRKGTSGGGAQEQRTQLLEEQRSSGEEEDAKGAAVVFWGNRGPIARAGATAVGIADAGSRERERDVGREARGEDLQEGAGLRHGTG